MRPLRGSFWVLVLYDVAEQIQLDKLWQSHRRSTDKVAASRVGVTDYRNLVEEKLRTAGELYGFMTNEFH